MAFVVVSEEGKIRQEVDDVNPLLRRTTFFAAPVFGPNDAFEDGAELEVRHPRIRARANNRYIAIKSGRDTVLGELYLTAQEEVSPGTWVDLPNQPVVNGRTERSWNYGPCRARLGSDGKWTFRLTPGAIGTFRLRLRMVPTDNLPAPVTSGRRGRPKPVSAKWTNGLSWSWVDMIDDTARIGIGEGARADVVAINTQPVNFTSVDQVEVYDPTFTDDADWSADVDDGGNKYISDGSDWGGLDSGDNIYRTGMRFNISTLPVNDDVTLSEFLGEVTAVANMATHSHYLGPYNGDGLADPEADAGSTMYTRCDVSGDNYGSTTDFRTTGSKVVDLGATANSDIETARDSQTTFSLAIQLVDESPQASDKYAQFTEFDGTDPPALRITHSASTPTLVAPLLTNVNSFPTQTVTGGATSNLRIGRWTGGVQSQGNLPEVWTAPTNLFPTEQRNDSGVYSFAAATSRLTLPGSNLADGYLFVGSYEYEDTSNGRFNPQGQFEQASGTGNFVGGPTGGYNRDTSEDRSFVRCWGFIDTPSASAAIDFEWKADADDATGGTVISTLDVISFFYSDIAMYESTDNSLLGGTTPNVVGSWTTVKEGTNITRSGNVVTLAGDNKRYLILASQFFEGLGGGTRTQRWHGLDVDGAQENAAKAYSYYRNTSNDENGDMFTWLIETGTANVTIEMTCYRGDGVGAGQGGADVDGTAAASGDHTLVIIELNDSAEVFRTENTAQSGDLNVTGPVDLPVSPVTGVAFNDATSWTRTNDTAMNAEVAMDALFGSNQSAAQEVVATTSRWTARSHITVDGVEDDDTRCGEYGRNNQGSADTFGWSANTLGWVTLAQDETVGVSIQEITGGEDGGQFEVQVGWGGFWGINLDTLQPADTGQTLSSPAFTDADTFQTHTAAPQAVTLVASLFDDGDTFPAHTAAPGAVTLVAPLFADPDTFPAHTLTAGAVTLVAPLFADGDTFPTHVLVQDGGDQTLVSPAFTDADTFPAHTVAPQAVTLVAPLFSDPDTFPAHTIDAGAVALTAPLFADPDTFPAHTVAPGAVALTAPFLDDPDTFPTHLINQGQQLTAPLFVDGDTFLAHTVTTGAVTLSAPLFVDGDVLFNHTITLGADGAALIYPIMLRKRRRQ